MNDLDLRSKDAAQTSVRRVNFNSFYFYALNLNVLFHKPCCLTPVRKCQIVVFLGFFPQTRAFYDSFLTSARPYRAQLFTPSFFSKDIEFVTGVLQFLMSFFCE